MSNELWVFGLDRRPKGHIVRSIGYTIRWCRGRDLQSPFILSGHSHLYSETVNNKFAVTERTSQRSSLTVKHFYFCPQTAYWFQNEQKPLKIVQKQTWKAVLYCPTAKFWLSNWKKIIFQLGNKNFPTGHFRLSSWIYTKIRFCKEFWWHADDTDSTDDRRFWFLTEEQKNKFLGLEQWAMSGEYTNVILNSFQDLSAEKDKKRLAVRCWNKFSMTRW